MKTQPVNSNQSTPNVDETIANAARHFNNGDLEKAEFLCRRFLQNKAADADALHLLALISVRRNRMDEAIKLFKQACVSRPKDAAQIHLDLSIVQKAAGDTQSAIVSCREAIRLNPNFLTAQIHLGNLLYLENDLVNAVVAYEQAAKIDPDNAIALNGLGVAQTALGNYHEAKKILERAVSAGSDLPDAYNNLAVVYLLLGQYDQAIAGLNRAVRLRPEYAEAWRNFGNVLAEKKCYLEAVNCYQKSLKLAPAFYEAQLDLSIAFKELGEIAPAKAGFQLAAQINPGALAPLCGFIGASLPNFYRTVDEIASSAKEYIELFKELEKRIETGAYNPAEAEDALALVQPYYLTYQGKDDRKLNTQYGKLLHKVIAQLYPQWSKNKANFSNNSGYTLGKKIRLGIVSRNFSNHADWKMITSGIVNNFDRQRFEIFAYSTGGVSDAVTTLASKKMEQFYSGLSFYNTCKQIEIDKPDILLFPGLGMDHVSTKIACLRLAPVQCCAWGRPETTGLPTIDYFISPESMEPDNAQSFYEEKLITISGPGFYYEPQEWANKVDSIQIPGLRADAIKFLCVQALFKYLPQYDFIFAQLAKTIPNSQFIFIARPDGLASKFIERLQTLFVSQGLNPAQHLIMLPWLDHSQFAALCEMSDLFLDSIGFSGCITVLDALEQSLPIVTINGTLMRGRQAAGILNYLGLNELVAENADEFIVKSLRLAENPTYRQSIKEKIAQTRSKLYKDASVTKNLENTFQSWVAAK